ncbi:palmitoyltransferase ZDHHC21-like [Tubulanus polymorphus]|uniref:palmitoyltransferase ZDHHC21-like n=1 Tax=Tubulanus polymorphus TaxID=672921 RepID=UPI003DA22D8B
MMVLRVVCRNIRCVNDVYGYMGIGTVIFYWVYNTYLTMNIVLIPNYNEQKISALFILIYSFIAVGCIVSLLKATFSNPGRVPSQEELMELDEEDRNVCPICEKLRPSRAHHCRRCRQCVTRMDHHCPWINNCVGEGNHYAFIQLLIYAALLSGLTLMLGILHFYVYLPCTQCDQTSFLHKHNWGLMVSVVVFAMFMVVPMSGMLTASHINFLVDRTTIDNLRDPFPDIHHLFFRPDVKSFREIYTEVCGTPSPWRWLSPCHIRKSRHRIVNY